MANISAEMVKQLRELTGMGMMECKKALEENQGDKEKAIVWLRERGMARAAKKADRVAAEGCVEVAVSADKTAGILLEVNCQTDFVGNGAEFRQLTKEAAELALKNKCNTVAELLGSKLSSGLSIENRLIELSGKSGEKMEIRRMTVLKSSNGTVSGYSHMGGKIGTLVVLDGAKGADAENLGKDVAMHVAASSPRYLTEAQIDQTEMAQEREIARKKLEEEGKKADMIDKILVGQMKKFAKEVCLVDQPFVKDPNVTVSKHVENTNKAAKLAGFARFALGEGIEKSKASFAEEVAQQAAQASRN